MLISSMSWLAIGVVPPRAVEHAEPLSFTEGLQVVAAIAVIIWLAVHFNAWIETKIASKQLLREIRRELRDHAPGSRGE